jgi:hypothetical protein
MYICMANSQLSAINKINNIHTNINCAVGTANTVYTYTGLYISQESGGDGASTINMLHITVA